MSLENHLDNPYSAWMAGVGEDSDVVVSSRVRLARNLEGRPFPQRLEPAAAEAILMQTEDVIRRWPGDWEFIRLGELSPLERRVLVEKHLISPAHAEKPAHRGLALNADETEAIMVNEEDHLRIQALQSDLDLAGTWDRSVELDDRLEQDLDFAFDADLGYLSACPTNLGTGLRASVMMHLPALTFTRRLGPLLGSLAKQGLAVRGLYGEGTEAAGHLFQISNQTTLGRTEMEIIQTIHQVADQVAAEERAARQSLLQGGAERLQDRVGRAWGILLGARILSGEEAMRLLSDLRLGVEMNLVDGVSRQTLSELLVITRPGFLERSAGREMDRLERDIHRANLVRERLEAGE